MNRKQFTCPIEKTLRIIGKKWTLLIIRDLLGGKKRFSQLAQSLYQISPRTLSSRLKDLEKNEIIKKKIFNQIPPRVEYQLTQKGKGLKDILNQIRKWGSKN
jgi:DNA-binding HxlR family transcriptional regulator